MRGMIVIAMIAALAMVTAGFIATQTTGGDGADSHPAGAVVTPAATQRTAGVEPSGQPGETPTGTSGEQSTVNPSEPTEPVGETDGSQPVANVLPANPPVRGAPINGIQAVEDYYSEQHRFDNIVVAWRPGAFPPERADQVAAQARTAIDEVNAKLGTNDHGEFEILLADQMYLERDCHGCQGYAFSDFRQVYILQDGSMAEDEFQALLTHEIGHIISGNQIALPHVATLFMAEGLATWLMTPPLIDNGYIEPKQIAAWAMQAGLLPPIWELREAKFEGRTGARLEYDPASSFTQFVIETYGMDAYKRVYAAEPPDEVLGKTWDQLEQEWHAWLAPWADNTVNGVDGQAWWDASATVTQGFERLYDDETTVSQTQYADLATARVALNKGDLEATVRLMQASGLVPGTAN